jgi:phage/plasmid-like protein (TIGR03299 family)
MAHEIGEMFWYGAVPWHGLGRQARQPLTLDEALAQGGLNWNVGLVPIATADGAASPAAHRRAVVRSDREPGHPARVVGVVHPGFRPLQNREGGELFDRLFHPGARKYHTGGYLRNGEVVWLLARLPEDIRVGGDDVVETYLLYSNSHDGSQPIDIRLTTVRVVCRNTLSFALNGHSARAFRWRHRDDPSVIERVAVDFLQLTTRQIREQEKNFRELAARHCDDAAFARFLARLLPDPPPPQSLGAGGTAVRAWNTRRTTVAAARAALTNVRTEGVPAREIPPDMPTWWGAVNAVTGWVDHLQRTGGDRYAHALFGTGKRLKSHALELAVEMSTN